MTTLAIGTAVHNYFIQLLHPITADNYGIQLLSLKTSGRHACQAQRLIQLPQGEQPRIGRDIGSVEFDFHRTLEFDPQRFLASLHPLGSPISFPPLPPKILLLYMIL